MKITKQYLKQIIKEELKNVLRQIQPGHAFVEAPRAGTSSRSLKRLMYKKYIAQDPENAISPEDFDALFDQYLLDRELKIKPGMERKDVIDILKRRGHDPRGEWWKELEYNDPLRQQYRAWYKKEGNK